MAPGTYTTNPEEKSQRERRTVGNRSGIRQLVPSAIEHEWRRRHGVVRQVRNRQGQSLSPARIVWYNCSR
jgi:hypothetical protein